MGNFFFSLKEKVANLEVGQKIVLALLALSVIISIILLITPTKSQKGVGVLPSPPATQPQSLPQKIINQISQAFKKMPQPVSPIPTPTPWFPPTQALTAKQIAETTINYLDQQKRPDGFYSFYAHYRDWCQDLNNPASCPLGEKNTLEISNMWVVLARLAYYQKFSQNSNDLITAQTDAQVLIDYCQQNLGNCMATLIPISNLYQQTQKNEYKDFLVSLGDLLAKEKYEQNVMALGTQARQLARLYQIFADDRYLQAASQRLAEAQMVAEAYQARYETGGQEACYLVLAQTEIGQASSNQTIINQASAFFKEDKEKAVPGQMTLIQPCIEAAYELGSLLDDQSIKSKASTLLAKYVVERWDGPGLARGYQEGGFFSGLDWQRVNITDTAYMIYLLSFEPERSYSFTNAN